MGKSLLYFAYGSNLLRERITIRNPSAVMKTVAKLENYRLCFNGDYKDSTWGGPPADVRKDPGTTVWGIVWELDQSDVEHLDQQEGVPHVYIPIEVTVQSQEGEKLVCRSYEKVNHTEDLPPSPQYLDVIVRGAKQNKLPSDYIAKLEKIEHNKYSGRVELYENILKKMKENENK